ncbi:DUF4345 domain-containing protein [Kocuria sp. HSID16901]|uniref:DUF4345 domain-containing protein n=1 Tax=Kocuria sp. HSID16901 TaxID=2419505 RepID=UPI00069D8153|nr:DUF4345 domain-containing protein [Kocuria sp. HSID16901]RUQ21144.1 DUF4345 domain-containing protein [Kocuria sp. HSID16901]
MTTPPTPENGGAAGPGPKSPSPWSRREAEAPAGQQPAAEGAGRQRPSEPTQTTHQKANPTVGSAPGTKPADGPARGPAAQKPSQDSRKRQKPAQGKPASKQQDWGLFRTVVALYGLLIIAYGVWQIVAGTSSLPGETDKSSATVAASYGALAAVLCGVGAAFVAIAIKFKWANVLWFVCLMIFMGGIGRILSWAIFGLPHPLMIVMMVLDLVIPPCLLVWHAWVTKANRIRRDLAQGAAPASQTRPESKRARRS